MVDRSEICGETVVFYVVGGAEEWAVYRFFRQKASGVYGLNLGCPRW